jgi:uncharacterized protein with GYD domain
MVRYIMLIKWTDQGIRDAKDTLTRTDLEKDLLKKLGGRLVESYWTHGAYDLVAIAEFPDEETATAVLLLIGRGGNVRTETLRAFNEDEMGRILKRLAEL